jgi:hypothetical protein
MGLFSALRRWFSSPTSVTSDSSPEPGISHHHEVIGMPPLIFVEGVPTGYSNANEQDWKQRLLNGIGSPSMGGNEFGVALHFGLPSLSVRGRPFDLDNLCEPVFSVLVNARRWFGGKRTNIRWWRATKCVSTQVGCSIAIETVNNSPPVPTVDPRFEGVYHGYLPTSARDEKLVRWARDESHKAAIVPSETNYILCLEFGDGSLNLGDIASGPAKHFIDCLFPFYGGEMGAPDDHRISEIVVTKPTPDCRRTAVRVRLWH